MTANTEDAARQLIGDMAKQHTSAIDALTAKVAKLEDVTRRQAMLITKLVREQGPVVDAAKAWRRAFGGCNQCVADVQLADAVDKLAGGG